MMVEGGGFAEVCIKTGSILMEEILRAPGFVLNKHIFLGRIRPELIVLVYKNIFENCRGARQLFD